MTLNNLTTFQGLAVALVGLVAAVAYIDAVFSEWVHSTKVVDGSREDSLLNTLDTTTISHLHSEVLDYRVSPLHTKLVTTKVHTKYNMALLHKIRLHKQSKGVQY